MARIRTIKPEFFDHEDLYDTEEESGLPIRLAYIGLWTECDREGRFEWKPRRLKARILPFDDVDFSRVLHALTTRGFISRYSVDGKQYGYVPTWNLHQVVNNREKESDLPGPEQADEVVDATIDNETTYDACPTREPRVPHEHAESLCNAQGEREREREREREQEQTLSLETDLQKPLIEVEKPEPPPKEPDPPGFVEFWESYPKRNGIRIGRKKCVSLWKKIPASERGSVMIGVKNYAQSKQAMDGYAKDPERWLRDELWKDFIGSTGPPHSNNTTEKAPSVPQDAPKPNKRRLITKRGSGVSELSGRAS